MKGWQRLLLIIIPYVFIVGFFQFIGALISGMDITDLDPQHLDVIANSPYSENGINFFS